jgi:hypothetical protein
MKRCIFAISLRGGAALPWLLWFGAAAAQDPSAAYTMKARAAFLAVDRAAQVLHVCPRRCFLRDRGVSTELSLGHSDGDDPHKSLPSSGRKH